MFKFLRRLFIVFILIVVVFVIYRYINPNGANKTLEKVKSVPTTISSWFHKDKSDVIFESETTLITGDVQKSDLEQNDNKKDEEENKNWLEALNKEIEAILGKDKKEVVVDETILTGTKEVVENTGSEMSGELETNLNNGVVLEINTGIVVDANTGPIIETKKEEVETAVTNITSNVNNTVKKATNKLTNFDYQQIKNVFGNLFK